MEEADPLQMHISVSVTEQAAEAQIRKKMQDTDENIFEQSR